MSQPARKKPAQPPTPGPVPAAPAAYPDKALSACRGCAFWAPLPEPAGHTGECREGPPSHPSGDFFGRSRLYTYRLTAADLPACGRYLAK